MRLYYILTAKAPRCRISLEIGITLASNPNVSELAVEITFWATALNFFVS